MLRVRLQQTASPMLDVNLQCNNDEMLALVGPSGAGKTTVLRCIAGLHKSFDGEIHCDGDTWFDSEKRINQPPQQRKVGMVFQHYALFPHMTVADNIAIALANKQARQRKVDALLQQVHLSGLASRYPAQLSGGQQQRVALARALARGPKVLLLDEPFSAVDKVTRRKLYLELHALRRELHIPIVLVTHDLDEAAMLADSMCVIHQGRTLQQGSPDQVLHRPDNLSVAKQVDVRNLFSGQISRQAGKQYLRWYQYQLEIEGDEKWQDGQIVNWTISPSKVLLHQRVRPSRGELENPVSGKITEMLTLRGITTVLIQETQSQQTMQMDISEHVVIRNQLQIGECIHLSLLSTAIHLMAE